MSGRGVMKWSNGDLFDGFWSNGLRHGSGFYRFADGSYYFGTWSKGLKDGPGTFYPAGNKHLRKLNLEGHKDKKKKQLSRNSSYDSEESVIPSVKRTLSDKISSSFRRSSGRFSHKTTSLDEDLGHSDSMRENDDTMPYSDMLYEVDRYTVGKITPVPMREVRSSDFGEQARIRMYFPRKGSQLTPPHNSVDFYWKDYCPMESEELFKLNAADYMMSICGDDGLRELSSPGKSGSIFYLSHDDKFVIKTLKKSELKVRFVVMGNMFCTELRIHRRYDLKGSSHGRFTNKDEIDETTTLKDLDLTYEFHMDRLLHESLFRQLTLDCAFLESQQIIDYSLLLGLHFRAPEHLRSLSEPSDSPGNAETTNAVDGVISQGDLLIPPRGLLLVTHEPGSVSTTPGPHIRGSTLKAYSIGNKEADLLLPGTGRLRVQLGVNMPAQANHRLTQAKTDSAEVELFEVYDVVLYLGIIDILQEYNMKKKMEHACKSLKFDPMSISVVEPKLYSKRFITFLEKVFPHDP
ncbi:UNVERIFIED_CONTAM: Phosphatidylinositol 4-phosphate 5-kinase [Sesamum latifolium]|uniref:1-phosphatidylinositol-4-phosphate 5-kinase n=1 Tax=Sesamum latifolium TaxID=2727402 RepID=A0AAW2V1U6_9LAMI